MPKLIDCIEAVAFDLDGTLIDTAPDLGSAANMMLVMLGGRPLPEQQVPKLIGAGIDEFVKRVLKSSGIAPDRALESAAALLFRNLYGQRLFERSRIYPGVANTLRTLRTGGRTLCCVTNKESKFALALLEFAGLRDFFQAVFCADRPEDRKPSPNLLRAACAHAAVEPAKLLCVGDSRADIGAAHAAGCRVVAVDYGYHRDLPLAQLRPDAVVSNVEEIFELSLRSCDDAWRAIGRGNCMSAEPNRSPVFRSHRDAINVLRALAMDAVQKANSGHPGMPMGMAEIAEVLWQRHLRHNPANPQWFNRDRFVLSNGHGSMLLYALLHLTGYDLPLQQLQRFRQLHSKTPGHPEYGITPGVETTTGPLGQGIANAVGMALAEKVLAAQFNRPGHEIVDHHTYVFLGDGCLMEGISHEACSLAGTLGLSKLIAFYDDNGISIDGHVSGWFTDDTPRRFASYGWHVLPNVDGHDSEAIDNAIRAAKAMSDKPTLICCKTVIGHGSPNKAGSHDAHGAPLGEKEVAATRATLGWSHAPFEIPPHIYELWDARGVGADIEDAWRRRLESYGHAHPESSREFMRRIRGELPGDFGETVRRLITRTHAKAATIATRKASQEAIEGIAPALPELIGGSADLASSNLTLWSGSHAISSRSGGNYIYYGVREFGMAAVMNGLALHGGFIPYGGTFLTFSDYARNALRMAALMHIRCIFVFTHDSIGLGEDGPTHQPIEHLATLRLIPNMDVWRPCDTVETAVAWAAAIERTNGPTSLVFSRQSLPFQTRSPEEIDSIRRGGYVLVEPEAEPGAVIIATGSEVALAVDAQKALARAGIPVRVVSMPSTTVFDRQDAVYRERVLPPKLPCVAVEAGVTDIWRKYVGRSGAVIGIDHFGESAPAADLMRYFEFVPERVVEAVRSLLAPQ